MSQSTNTITLGLFGGFLLASMLFLNSRLGSVSSPIISSLIAHFVGFLTSLLICLILKFKKKDPEKKPISQTPLWTYLCGLLGGVVVIIGVKCVNSWLGVAGTVILNIVGQIVLSLFIDQYGLFGNKKIRPSKTELFGALLLIIGCAVVIASKL